MNNLAGGARPLRAVVAAGAVRIETKTFWIQDQHTIAFRTKRYENLSDPIDSGGEWQKGGNATEV